MKTTSLTLIIFLLTSQISFANPPCTPLGDQVTYGTNNVWIGYVYQGRNFGTYTGYVNEGNVSSPNFDESFGGDNVIYPTNGCGITTEDFSVRYKLTQNFTNADYAFTVGGDDGYRLSFDGGATWEVGQWSDHAYNTSTYTKHLNGTYNLVFEFYENGGGNRTSLSVVMACTGSGDPAIYGSNNTWIGYVYTGTSFNSYKGHIAEGNIFSPNFDESFGGANTAYATSDCPITTENFSVRYRLDKVFTNGTYSFVVGGDDGYRLSFDGGATWSINTWNDQSYITSSLTTVLNGPHSMVLEYYENGGDNRISFAMSGGTILPLQLLTFKGQASDDHRNLLSWRTSHEINTDYFTVQASVNGINFNNLGKIDTKSTGENTDTELNYSYTDLAPSNALMYYRLEMTDKNGHRTYSEVVKVANNAAKEIKIYPTVITNSGFFVSSTAAIYDAKLEIFDLSGKKISEMNWDNLAGKQQVTLSALGKLSNGSYVVRLSSKGSSLFTQLIMVANH